MLEVHRGAGVGAWGEEAATIETEVLLGRPYASFRALTKVLTTCFAFNIRFAFAAVTFLASLLNIFLILPCNLVLLYSLFVYCLVV